MMQVSNFDHKTPTNKPTWWGYCYCQLPLIWSPGSWSGSAVTTEICVEPMRQPGWSHRNCWRLQQVRKQISPHFLDSPVTRKAEYITSCAMDLYLQPLKKTDSVYLRRTFRFHLCKQSLWVFYCALELKVADIADSVMPTGTLISLLPITLKLWKKTNVCRVYAFELVKIDL